MLRENVYDTNYGKIIVPSNDEHFIQSFNDGKYWGGEEIQHNLSLIDKSKNILEFGSHIGTHTIPYAKYLNDDCLVYSYEPQKDIYDILQKNIVNNNLSKKVISKNGALFYYNGSINMNNNFLDGSFTGLVSESIDVNCNYGGLSIGSGGEVTKCYKIDDLNLEKIGFIHSDAQGSEPFVFWGAKETIKKYKPTIVFENMDFYGTYLYENILKYYEISEEISKFNIIDYCMGSLSYKECIKGYNTYLIP